MKIEVSNGEIADKYTILKLKLKHCTPMSSQYFNIQEEHMILFDAVDQLKLNQSLIEELYEINKELWEIEDKIRILEQQQNFGEEFVKLARLVYITNDKRFLAKKKINTESNSKLHEEKILPKYD
jgi:hypothetical protein